MNKIKFSHNWNNKLNNDIFTTIRNWTHKKEREYFNQLNDLFCIELNGKKFREARLIDVNVKEVIEIDITLLRLDTGLLGKGEIDKLFFDFDIEDYVLILTFAKP